MLATRTFSQTGQPTLRIDQDHDAFGRLTEQRRYSDAAGTTLVSPSEYTDNALGQLVSQTDHGRTVDYAYDADGNRDGVNDSLRATCDCDRRNPPVRCSQMP